MNVNKYLMVLAIGTSMLVICLLVFHIPILAVRPLLLIAIGLIGIWAIYYWRKGKINEQEEVQAGIEVEKCWCHICEHTEARYCLKSSCSCCMIIKKGQIIAHESL